MEAENLYFNKLEGDDLYDATFWKWYKNHNKAYFGQEYISKSKKKYLYYYYDYTCEYIIICNNPLWIWNYIENKKSK